MSDLQQRNAAYIAQLRAAEEAALAAGDNVEARIKRGQRELLEFAWAQVVAGQQAKQGQMQLAKLTALVRKYVAAQKTTGQTRPKLGDVAHEFGWESEQPLRDYCRDLGIEDWHDVHMLVAAARG